MRTLVFPDDFVKTKKIETYNIRFTPNFFGENIVPEEMYSNVDKRCTKFSYCYVAPWNINRYVFSDVSIFRMYDRVRRFIKDTNRDFFSLDSENSIKLSIRKEDSKIFIEDISRITSSHNQIYNSYHPGKNNLQNIKSNLQKVSISIESMSIENMMNGSIKKLLIDRYKDVTRNEKLNNIIYGE